LPGSTAESGGAKPDSFRAASQAIQDSFNRRGVEATVLQPDWAIKASCGIFTHKFPDEGPHVSIIIPTKNNVAVLKPCIESIKKTSYKNYDVVIVDNESDDPDTLVYLSATTHRVLRIRNTEIGFSFAAINNRAAQQVKSDYLLFLNNDTEVITPDWLSQMVGFLGLSRVGAVGARLRYPDGRLQHAGIVHGYYDGMAGPAFKLLPASNHGYLSYTMVARNYSAVTAACMLTRRDLFLELGGFDEHNFSVAYNDVDYCYRLLDDGYRVAYCPAAELIHHEGLSRGFRDNPAEPAAFRKKYRAFRDPYYNPNLSLSDERFALDVRTIAPEGIKPIRTLMCAFNLNREGAPHSQFELTINLKDRGIIDPVVYCSQEGPLRAAYEERGIKVRVLKHPLADVYDGAAYDRAIQAFANSIREWDIELIYANTRQTFYAIDAAKRLGLPSVWNPRESEPWETYFDYLGPDVARRALECFRYPYKVVFVSNATLESCASLNTSYNFMTIHNGLDLESFNAALKQWPREKARSSLKIRSDETAILLLGTVCERKGQLDLVAAIAQLNDESIRKLRCFIVGDRPGDYSDQLKSAIGRLPASKQQIIEVVAETSDTARYYSAADVLAFTSRVESFPRVILEAMAAGLPIITTPVYGVAEQVQENINALFYSPGDASTLANHIERLLSKPDLRQKLSKNSKCVLDTLTDFDAMTSSYAAVFREAWLTGGPA
jgi:GT2 family glycosyltransferase/glycosyltransferase involved in cell wall biosynthesis